MLNDPATFTSAFLLGLLGSAHCLGMCGGLASALGLHSSPNTLIASSGREKSDTASAPFLLFCYNTGRILSYCLAGLIIGSLGFWLSQSLATLTLLRYLAASMLILMGLYLGQWFNGIVFAEKLGSQLWRFIQPFSKRFLPIRRPKEAFAVGMVWGWLPCGLVYSALIWASAQANVINSVSIMFCFGLGTLPSMLATGYFAQQLGGLIKQKWFRSVAGAMMIIFGIWSMPLIQSGIFASLR